MPLLPRWPERPCFPSTVPHHPATVLQNRRFLADRGSLFCHGALRKLFFSDRGRTIGHGHRVNRSTHGAWQSAIGPFCCNSAILPMPDLSGRTGHLPRSPETGASMPSWQDFLPRSPTNRTSHPTVARTRATVPHKPCCTPHRDKSTRHGPPQTAIYVPPWRKALPRCFSNSRTAPTVTNVNATPHQRREPTSYPTIRIALAANAPLSWPPRPRPCRSPAVPARPPAP